MGKIKTVGVVVITYNGEKYILQQLESIYAQSFKPHMVLIVDDHSTDSTAEIALNFIRERDLRNWRFLQNQKNLGWQKNCCAALNQCEADIVFWSDQDDVWQVDKLKTMTEIMKSQRFLAIYSGWDYIGADGHKQGCFVGTGSGCIREVVPSHKKNHLPPLLGCSACFRKSLLLRLKAILPCDFGSPDWLLFYLGITFGSVGFVDLPLFHRRIHDSNVTVAHGALKHSWTFSYSHHIKSLYVMSMQCATLDKILLMAENDLSAETAFVEAERNYLRNRIRFVHSRTGFIQYVKTSIEHCPFSDFVNTFLKDLFFVYSYGKNRP